MTKPIPTPQQTELAILEALEDLVSIVDNEYRYRAVSHGYTRFFGLPARSIVGKTVAELHGTERFEQHIKQDLDRCLAGEEVKLSFWGQNHLGEPRFIDSRHTLYTGSLVETTGVAVVARDVTDLIEAQNALEKERYLLTLMADALPDFIFVKNLSGVYQHCNKSFEAFLESNTEAIIGKTDAELMSKRSSNYIRERDQEVIQSKKRKRKDEWVTYNDGSRRLIDMLKIPILNQQNEVEGLIGIGHDVTRERETERKLQLAALVFETTSDYCFILSSKGGIVSANSAAKSEFNPLNDTQNISIHDLFHCLSPACDLVTILNTQLSWQGELLSHSHAPYLATLNAVLDRGDVPETFVLTLRDNSEHKALEKELTSKAYNDSLTGLPNRLLLHTKLETAIIRAERQRRQIAVLFIDLDGFKPVNDMYGHFEGDKILVDVAQRLKGNLRQCDTVARLGGDEFVALLDISLPVHAGKVANKLLASLDKSFTIENNQINISACIGISLFPGDASCADELLQHADSAMYRAKSQGSRQISFYCEL